MKADTSLRQRFDKLQCGVESAAQSAVRMIPIDLVCRALSERVEEVSHGSWIGHVVCWLGECALKVQQAFSSKKANHFTKLEGIALRRGVVA